MREPGGITKPRIRPVNLPKYFMIGLIKYASQDVGYLYDLKVEIQFDIARCLYDGDHVESVCFWGAGCYVAGMYD